MRYARSRLSSVCAEEVAHQQHLVAGGGDLRHKDDVVARAGGLVLAAVVAVQRVAHLVGEGELAVEVVLVVEQDVRVRIAVAGGVGSAALTDVLIDVNPAVVKALAQQRRVVLSEDGERVEYGLFGLLKGDFFVGVATTGV